MTTQDAINDAIARRMRDHVAKLERELQQVQEAAAGLPKSRRAGLDQSLKMIEANLATAKELMEGMISQ